MIHPGTNESSPFEILDILSAQGGEITRTVIGHMDRTMQDRQKLVELARRGCYLEFDLFGTECSHYQVKGAI